MFYVIIFAALAVLLVVAGLTLQARNRSKLQAESPRRTSAAQRRNRKQERAQSRAARRRRR
jgi:Flp pilus assembly protein TadB